MKTSLCSSWDFIAGFDPSYLTKTPAKAEKVDLPHAVRLTPYHDFSPETYFGEFTYAKTFDHPRPGRRVYLHFAGAMLQFDLYLNGKDLGHFVSGYLPVTVDVTASLKESKNRLVVKLSTKEDKTVPPFGGVVDYLTFGGIYRGVYLIDAPLEGEIKEPYAFGNGKGEIFLSYDSPSPVQARLYENELEVHAFSGKKGVYEGRKVYTPETPFLYRLELDNGTDVVSLPFAFKDEEFNEFGFFLQGKRYRLLGLNRHQTFPYIGAAAPKSLQIQDARLLKSLGVNVVRTSHYTDDESFLDECDRLGLFVINEVPGWQHVSKDPLWRKRFLSFIERMVKKERQHPCLLAYGVRIDESPDDHELYAEANRIQKACDPYRPSIGVRYFKDSECLEDIYGYNDFSCSSLRHGVDPSCSLTGAKGKATLITEHNGHMFPTKATDPASRLREHALRHALVVEEAFADPNLAGVIGWCAFDYATHKEFGPGDGLCYHGVCDLFREKKWAGHFYESQGEIPMMEPATDFLSSGQDGGRLPTPVIFSNADYIEYYRGGVKVTTLRPDYAAYPHLKHPPFFLTKQVDLNFHEEGLSEKESRLIVDSLNLYAEKGFEGFSLRRKLRVLAFLKKHRLPYSYVYDLYGKYLGSWGSLDNATITLKAYKDGKLFDEKTYGLIERTLLRAAADEERLVNEDTYDATRVLVEKVDQFGNKARFADDELLLETSGPIRLFSPKIVHLHGGSIGIYLRSLSVDKPTPAKLLIHHRDGTLEVPLLVEGKLA